LPISDRPLIALSSCLAGEKVRYDSAHKRDRWLMNEFSEYVDYANFCPEVGIGLTIPRTPIRLVHKDNDVRVLDVRDPSIDVTDRLRNFAFDTVPKLEGMSGYVFKSKSPSCGLFKVKAYMENGHPSDTPVPGAYAEVLAQELPDLPMEEEGRLCDDMLRENFVNRIFVYHRLLKLKDEGLSAKAIIEFHSHHKYMIMAHSQVAYQSLGQKVANLKGIDLDVFYLEYRRELMAALTQRVKRRQHVNVMQHLTGYLKKSVDADDKKEILEALDDYKRGDVPLVVPMKLLAHYFRCHPDPYIGDQYYLNPYPSSLKLRNNV
jgi:uncharacterized protein YbgA (DUF1722 family)/uncharacterized protein YbbK (DUF523 family)